MIRPGYFDSRYRYSSGSTNGRRDNYTAHNVDAIAAALETLKASHRAERLILAGHCGGAAISGVIIGRYPELTDGAVLAACPCDIARWRRSRGGEWPNSLSPSDIADNVAADTRVIAIAGSNDTNTRPALTIDYIERLRARGIDARYQVLDSVGHNGVARSQQFFDAIITLATEG